jgi:two-component system, sensor histidine kinase and response regulator
LEAHGDQEGEQEYSSLHAGTTALVAELLATIKAYTATLLRPRRSISRAERSAFLLEIERANEHLVVIIDHLLEMAFLETGTLALELSTVNLAQLVRETISAVGHRAEAEQVIAARRLRFHLEDRQSVPGDEVLIEADRHLLREVLEELLGNAITYSPGGGAIEVVLRTASPSARAERLDLSLEGGAELGSQTVPTLSGRLNEREWVEISVRDEGLGMAADNLARVFDPFYRVDMRLARDVNGHGIGLTICKRIVELHGGAIWVESTSGAGSTFQVQLPRGGPRAAST